MSAVNLNKIGTLWRYVGNDGYGGKSYQTPELISIKTATKSLINYGGEGSGSVVVKIFYTDSNPVKGDFIAEGEYADLTPVSGSSEINEAIINDLHPTLTKAVC